MIKTDHNSCSTLLTQPVALLSKGRRRGWLNVKPGVAVNSDQSLNPHLAGRLDMLDAETFGVSGGKYVGLKPSLAR